MAARGASSRRCSSSASRFRSAAQADADPAGDYLYTTNVFLPLTTKVSPQLARELRAATAAAAKAGNPIRVALIATSTDLGGVPSLFGKPTDYSRFLDAELQFAYSGRLLVVMPQGAALTAHGRQEADEAVIQYVRPYPRYLFPKGF